MDMLVYALLQGLLEWLPVSSSGVLVLLGMSVSGALGVHLATGLAGLVYSVRWRGRLARLWLWWGIVPLLVGAPVALVLDNLVEGLPAPTLHRLVVALYTVTILALLARLAARSGGGGSGSRLDPVVAGILQGVAVLPGVSRSGLVSAYLLLRGYEPGLVVEAVVASGAFAGLAAGAYEAVRRGFRPEPLALLATFLAAIASAYLLDLVGEKGRVALTVLVLAGLLAGLAAGLLA